MKRLILILLLCLIPIRPAYASTFDGTAADGWKTEADDDFDEDMWNDTHSGVQDQINDISASTASIKSQVDQNTVDISTNSTAISALRSDVNTNIVDISTNSTAIGLNTTHRTSNDGSDHSFIDQSITTISSPTFAGAILTNGVTAYSVTGTDFYGIEDEDLPSEISALVSSFPVTAVTAGSYTATDLTVNAQGMITAASNGSGGGGITHGAFRADISANAFVTTDIAGWTSPNYAISLTTVTITYPYNATNPEQITATSLDMTDHTIPANSDLRLDITSVTDGDTYGLFLSSAPASGVHVPIFSSTTTLQMSDVLGGGNIRVSIEWTKD